MHALRVALFAAGLLAAMPAAHADQRVVYKDADNRDFVFEVDDSGAIRVVGPSPAEYAILRAGELYMVGEQKGAPHVVRLGDLAAVAEEAIGPFFKTLMEAADDKPTGGKLVITTMGERTVGDFKGKAYSIKGLEHAKPDAALTWVASDDPALKPAGTALKAFVDMTLVMAAPLFGRAIESMLAENRQLFALGTPLDAGGKFRLASVTPQAIDDARFQLPAEPISRDALRAEMKAQTATPQQ
jgi:hypothetical protein